MRHTLLTSLSLYCLIACSAPTSKTENTNTANGTILAEKGWVRIPPPGADVTAGYLTLRAQGNDHTLIRVSSLEADAIEIHTMVHNNNRMVMNRMDALEIKSDHTHRLEPGGDHLMIFGLHDNALDDGRVDIILNFANSSSLELSLDARHVAPEMSHHGDHH